MTAFGPNNDVAIWTRVGRYLGDALSLPNAGNAQLQRSSRYGDSNVLPVSAKSFGACLEGSQFFTRSPTQGTGIASIAALATFTATSPFIIVQNNNPVGGRDVILDKLKLICTAAGTSGTDMQWATKTDTIPRFTSGGSGGNNTALSSILQGPFPLNTGSPSQSQALIYAGALVATADSSAAKVLESGKIRTTIPVVNEQITWGFGTTEEQMDGIAIATATAMQKFISHVPVVIAPGHTFLFHYWCASQSAASSFEVMLSHIER